MEICVTEIPDPSEGQQAIDQCGNVAVYIKGRWISKEEYDRGVYLRLLDVGDCV